MVEGLVGRWTRFTLQNLTPEAGLRAGSSRNFSALSGLCGPRIHGNRNSTKRWEEEMPQSLPTSSKWMKLR